MNREQIIEILKQVATHAITSELNPDELDDEGFEIFADRLEQQPEVSEEYIRDAIGVAVDQTRFYDVRLDHILKQKEQLTNELVKVFKVLNK